MRDEDSNLWVILSGASHIGSIIWTGIVMAALWNWHISGGAVPTLPAHTAIAGLALVTMARLYVEFPKRIPKTSYESAAVNCWKMALSAGFLFLGWLGAGP